MGRDEPRRVARSRVALSAQMASKYIIRRLGLACGWCMERGRWMGERWYRNEATWVE